MKAMLLYKTAPITKSSIPLQFVETDDPIPAENEILIKVSVCGVCHTELDEIEGRTAPPHLPVIPGHQVVGTVLEAGKVVEDFRPGDRVGVGWIYSACGSCDHCIKGFENLCERFVATGRDVNGGYAERMTIPARFAVAVPDGLDDTQVAPLLCAGGIGFRSLSLSGIKDGMKLGLTGFGASGHLVLLMVKHLYPATKVFVFARNPEERAFAADLGADWTGDTDSDSPEKLNAMIDTTPAWKPVLEALRNLESGGRLVINAIRKEDIDLDYLLLNLDYPEHFWMEKEIKSVANVTRSDLREMLRISAEFNIRPEIQLYPLEKANQALLDLKRGGSRGAKVLLVDNHAVN